LAQAQRLRWNEFCLLFLAVNGHCKNSEYNLLTDPARSTDMSPLVLARKLGWFVKSAALGPTEKGWDRYFPMDRHEGDREHSIKGLFRNRDLVVGTAMIICSHIFRTASCGLRAQGGSAFFILAWAAVSARPWTVFKASRGPRRSLPPGQLPPRTGWDGSRGRPAGRSRRPSARRLAHGN
jgi:hypothetical protein